MMKNLTFSLVFSWLFFNSLAAQIINGTDTLYGNEWIKFDQTYFKLMVAEDGIYRVGYQELSDAGLPVTTIVGSEYQLFHNGEEVPIYTSSPNIFSPTDYLEFYGQKNRSELDQHLFQNPEEEMMNPMYSLFTDTSAYFLTWSNAGTPLRFEEVENDLTNLPAKENYYLEEIVLEYHSSWDKEKNGQGVSVSNFTMAEGFSSGYANIQSFNLPISFPYINGPGAKLQVRYSGNLKQHSQLISLNGQTLTTDNYYGFVVRKLNFDIDNSFLNTTMELKFQGLTDNNDKQRISNIILTYPRVFNFNNTSSFPFKVKSAGVNKYLEIENFNAGNLSTLYDLTNWSRQMVVPENGLIKINLLPSQNDRDLILINSDLGIKKINSISRIDFINYSELDADFIFVSNPKLYDDGNGNNYVQEYADYRSSQLGGGYKTIIVDVQQLYDQFGWGINRHSLSIRNFGHFVKKEWEEVQYFFVVGKGREYNSIRSTSQLSASANFHVPTFGTPGADNLLTAYNSSNTPLIPIGRIASSSPNEVRIYLNKIKEAENNRNSPQTLDDKAWMRRVIHLGGGDAGLQTTIKNYLAQMEAEIESNGFGGEVSSFFKTSSDPVQISTSETIFNLINSGVSIITFFGHSGQNTFDFSLDSPENYENKGKYPLFFSLGCFSGNIHQDYLGVSERFVFEEEKGALVFIASSSLGYVSALNNLCGEFYHQLGADEYGKGLGIVMQKSISVLESEGLGGARELVQQFTLHGDPSYQLNPFPGPDYVVDYGSVRFSPEKINIERSDFDLSFNVRNIGKNINDSLSIAISRELPNGTTIVIISDTILAPANSTSLTFKIPTLGEEGLGQNRFFVKVDEGNSIAELPAPMAESNNELVNQTGILGVGINFFANDIRPVFPKEFAIIGNQPITLKASTSNVFANNRRYVIQIDTTEQFNSPLKKEHTVEMRGGVLKWQPDLTYQDELVYYWRVSPDSIDQSGFTWRTSSFIYLENELGGWNQSHFFQYEKNEFKDMELGGDRDFKYLDDFKDIVITQGTFPRIRQQIAVNNNPYLYIPWDGPIRGGVIIMVLDSITVNPWVNEITGPGSNVGQYNSNIPSWAVGYAAFPYSTRSVQSRKWAMNFIDSIIPPKNYVVLITVQEDPGVDYEPNEWAADSINNNGKNLFNLLEAQGATLIRSSEQTGAKPYYFVYKKDDPSFIPIEGFTDPDFITTKAVGLLGKWNNGEVGSPIIGPANSWNKIKWKLSDLNSDIDSIALEVFGIRDDGTSNLLISAANDLDIDIDTIEAAEFPFLKLRYYSSDDLMLDPPQLDYWRVLFEGTPDLALNPAAHFVVKNDSLQEGDPLVLEIGVENLSNIDVLDSISIIYVSKGENNERVEQLKKEKPLLADGSLISQIEIPTFGSKGIYDLQIEVNPLNKPREDIRFNNTGISNYRVEEDKRNPLLDVFFDGVKILNGDLVSAKPVIRVDLKDENNFLALADTSLFNIFFVYPEETELKRISFLDNDITYIPADLQSGENHAIVEISRVFEKDGIYQLIIQAEDVTGNQSGSIDYKVSFEVINAASISNIINYPNPFSTSTRFLYTMTGSEAPAKYKLQIMTVSGKIVREITQDEMGLLKPGTHLTEFTWNGTDEFGDQLANGVYLYRFVAKDMDGNEWEKYETEADSYNKSGFGKMVIVR